MEVNNLLVVERAPAPKSVEHINLNGLIKKSKMGDKEEQKLLNNARNKPKVIPKSASSGNNLNYRAHPEDVVIRSSLGDPNVVGLPLVENLAVAKNEICDIHKDVEALAYPPIFTLGHTSLSQSFPSRYSNSVRSSKSGESRPYLRPFSDTSSQLSRPFSDALSIRSLASIGMGSTDGKKMIIRKIPNSPSELFNIINPPTPPDEYLYDVDSFDDGSEDTGGSIRKPRRQLWSNKIQFVLACVGYSVGLGSVWRFPYLCYKSGGGVFLIPYFIIMVICGIPLLYMELAVGQFTGRGPIGAIGQLCPLFKGAGLASVVISFLMSTYYSVIIAYSIYYFFTSFKPTLPWEECSPQWDNCWIPAKLVQNVSKIQNTRTPAELFYDSKVLQISKGIEFPGSLRWELVACLLCAWFLVYFAIWKSIKSSAKVRYFTATFPFVLIIAFLVKSLTLEGANKGMRYFFRPKWELLGQAQVWVNAAAQTFNSMGIAFGSMISFASYNRFNNHILHDTLAVSFVNALTSLLVGIFAFATIGNIATEQNTTVENVIADGPGLIFYVYPQAIAKMPAARIWAALFFFMLLCLGLNSQFAIVEVVVTSIQDGFPTMIKKRLLCHEMLVLVVCVVSFLCGLPNVTNGGIYFFQLIDHYAASISIMYLAFFEIIAVAWIYGVNRISKNVESMTGRVPSLYFKFCWVIAAPLLIFAVWIFCLIDYEAPTYNKGKYHYPVWAVVLGWVISSLSILCIPLYAMYMFAKKPGGSFLDKLRNTVQSNMYECDKCGEHFCDHVHHHGQDGQPMLVLRNSDGKTPTNGIHFESVNYSSVPTTPNANTPLTRSPIINRTFPNRLKLNKPVDNNSVSDNTLSKSESQNQSSSINENDDCAPSSSNSETK
ncbi:hypothetical protein FQR65_LT03970 [Abscondita terminalis]|nr:hypothetical protein FQR65_LT03970 [Abscondita terminalis]